MKKYSLKIIAIVLFITAIVSLFATSCASLNSSHKYVTIHTTEPSKIIHNQDTISTIDNKVHLKVERKKEPLLFVATTDSLTKSIRIRHGSSVMYWANIPFNLGLGLIEDKNNPKRYSYPDKIFINSAEAKSKYYCCGKANNKGELYFHISQSLNIFFMAPESKYSGIGAGVIIPDKVYHPFRSKVYQ